MTLKKTIFGLKVSISIEELEKLMKLIQEAPEDFTEKLEELAKKKEERS